MPYQFFSKPPPPLQLTEASTMHYAVQLPRQKIIWAPFLMRVLQPWEAAGEQRSGIEEGTAMLLN